MLACLINLIRINIFLYLYLILELLDVSSFFFIIWFSSLLKYEKIPIFISFHHFHFMQPWCTFVFPSCGEIVILNAAHVICSLSTSRTKWFSESGWLVSSSCYLSFKGKCVMVYFWSAACCFSSSNPPLPRFCYSQPKWGLNRIRLVPSYSTEISQ